jgi:hypothetical protein
MRRSSRSATPIAGASGSQAPTKTCSPRGSIVTRSSSNSLGAETFGDAFSDPGRRTVPAAVGDQNLHDDLLLATIHPRCCVASKRPRPVVRQGACRGGEVHGHADADERSRTAALGAPRTEPPPASSESARSAPSTSHGAAAEAKSDHHQDDGEQRDEPTRGAGRRGTSLLRSPSARRFGRLRRPLDPGRTRRRNVAFHPSVRSTRNTSVLAVGMEPEAPGERRGQVSGRSIRAPGRAALTAAEVGRRPGRAALTRPERGADTRGEPRCEPCNG